LTWITKPVANDAPARSHYLITSHSPQPKTRGIRISREISLSAKERKNQWSCRRPEMEITKFPCIKTEAAQKRAGEHPIKEAAGENKKEGSEGGREREEEGQILTTGRGACSRPIARLPRWLRDSKKEGGQSVATETSKRAHSLRTHASAKTGLGERLSRWLTWLLEGGEREGRRRVDVCLPGE
jgi:hypothetical protein